MPTKSHKSIDLRLKGLRDESSKIGYKLKDEQTYLGSIPKHNGLTEEVGREVTTATKYQSIIVCMNDNQAIGAISVINELKYKIPEDVAVLGYDDIKA